MTLWFLKDILERSFSKSSSACKKSFVVLSFIIMLFCIRLLSRKPVSFSKLRLRISWFRYWHRCFWLEALCAALLIVSSGTSAPTHAIQPTIKKPWTKYFSRTRVKTAIQNLPSTRKASQFPKTNQGFVWHPVILCLFLVIFAPARLMAGHKFYLVCWTW